MKKKVVVIIVLIVLFYIGCTTIKENKSPGYLMNQAVKNGEAIYLPNTGEYILKKDLK
jgi:hypothetical protein